MGWAAVLAGSLVGGLNVGLAEVSVPAIEVLRTAQLSGIWYEQAAYGVKREKNCVADTVLLIAPGNAANQMLFVDSCKHKKHYTDDWQMLVFWKKGTAPTGKLRVRTLPLLSKPLDVVAVSADSDAPQWALLGTPNHKALAVYARIPVVSDAVLAEIKAAATARGYDAAKLKVTPQPNR